MKAMGTGGAEVDGMAADQAGAAWTRHTFAIGRLTRRSAEIRMIEREGGAAAATLLKALVRGRARGGATVH